jgi:Cu+-exporting ATPase
MTNPPRLEPRSPAAVAVGDRELRDLTRRFRIAVRLTVLVALAALGDHIPGVPLAYIAPPRFWVWFQLVLSTPIVLWSGAPLLRRGAIAIARGRPDRFALVAISVAALWTYSLVAAIRPELFGVTYRDDLGNVRLYFEVATVIVTLALVTWLIELRALTAAGAQIGALLAAMPRTTRRLRDDGFEEDASVVDLAPGTLVRVWPGETVPVDGEVIEGTSVVDESAITGDCAAVAKGRGDRVLAGGVNRGAAVLVRVEQVGPDTVLARLVRQAGAAVRGVSSIEGRADRTAVATAALALLIAIVTFAIWATRGPEPRLALAMLEAVAVLMVAAPSAFSLAARLPLAVAIARGARAGVVWKSAATIERMAGVEVPVASGRPLDDAADEPAAAVISGDPGAIGRPRRLARAAIAIVRQGLLLVFLYHAVGLATAAGALYPYFGVRVDPMIAAALALVCSLLLVANAQRLRWTRL